MNDKPIHDFSHILINSAPRAGGSLLARMLDGHPNLLVMPFEFNYATQKVMWPDWKALDKSKDFNRLSSELNLSYITKIEKLGYSSKDVYGRQKINFSYDTFVTECKNELEKYNSWTPNIIINSIFISFFKQLLPANALININYGVNHLSMMCFAPVGTFIEMYDEGLIIQPIRDPRSWYWSMKNHFRPFMHRKMFLYACILLWTESTLRAVINSRFYKNYKLLRYEELVLCPKQTMAELSEWLKIKFNSILTKPTINGSPWLGNSSKGPINGIDLNRTTDWKKGLEKYELEIINNECGDLMKVTGYGQEGIKTPDNKLTFVYSHLHHTSFPIKFDDETSLLLEENRRMALHVRNLFNDTIIRYTCGRYIQKEKIVRVVAKLFGLE